MPAKCLNHIVYAGNGPPIDLRNDRVFVIYDGETSWTELKTAKNIRALPSGSAVLVAPKTANVEYATIIRTLHGDPPPPWARVVEATNKSTARDREPPATLETLRQQNDHAAAASFAFTKSGSLKKTTEQHLATCSKEERVAIGVRCKESELGQLAPLLTDLELFAIAGQRTRAGVDALVGADPARFASALESGEIWGPLRTQVLRSDHIDVAALPLKGADLLDALANKNLPADKAAEGYAALLATLTTELEQLKDYQRPKQLQQFLATKKGKQLTTALARGVATKEALAPLLHTNPAYVPVSALQALARNDSVPSDVIAELWKWPDPRVREALVEKNPSTAAFDTDPIVRAQATKRFDELTDSAKETLRTDPDPLIQRLLPEKEKQSQPARSAKQIVWSGAALDNPRAVEDLLDAPTTGYVTSNFSEQRLLATARRMRENADDDTRALVEKLYRAAKDPTSSSEPAQKRHKELAAELGSARRFVPTDTPRSLDDVYLSIAEKCALDLEGNSGIGADTQAIQRAAARHHGIDPTRTDKGVVVGQPTDIDEYEAQMQPLLDSWVRTVHEETTARMQQSDLDALDVARGMQVSKDLAKSYNIKTSTLDDLRANAVSFKEITADDIPLRAMSSFSIDKATAARFAGEPREGRDEQIHIFLRATVPPEHIVGTSMTGACSMLEREVLVARTLDAYEMIAVSGDTLNAAIAEGLLDPKKPFSQVIDAAW